LHVLAALGGTERLLSDLLVGYQRYAASGEINSTVVDQASTVAAIRERWASRAAAEEATIDELDGLTVSGSDWWFNVRASNTEPLLRLNVEARDEERMQQICGDVLGQIRGDAP
jgi:phosphomannomutase